MKKSRASMPATGTAGTGTQPHNRSWSSPKPRRSQGNARLVAAQYFARPEPQSQAYQRRPQPTHSTTRTDATAAQRRRCGSSSREPRRTIKMSAAARASRSAGPCGSSEMPAIAARGQPRRGGARAFELRIGCPCRADARARASARAARNLGSARAGFSQPQTDHRVARS